MMDCRSFVERVTDYLEHNTSLPDRLRMRLHMMMCSVCRAFFRQMKETAHATHAAAHAAPDALSAELTERLMGAVDHDPH